MRKAAAFVDLPPAICGVNRMVEEAQAAVERLKESGAAVTSRVVSEEEMYDKRQRASTVFFNCILVYTQV